MFSLAKSFYTKQPTLLKVRTDLEGLVDISFFSTRPTEGECLYPPCAYLELRSETLVTAAEQPASPRAGDKSRRPSLKAPLKQAVKELKIAVDVSPQVRAEP